mmetsp:Transcript_9504/g.35258  ORF Transcript_9504/g.35258 Transcript_9504/m.35258 type:complete len:622 (-) Transcript_9504:131-1996(-)|eukprot:CAMPEP_0117436864 /NCGR_PEP_ID=MMETSP0759-20121206/1226_1 /TAXON_ID=63605 /ORGANISM="Percolomonas cosmopolitus, Strain WS" /LENGTH=621 /DNA_ID=CAMNT_0005228475 /DNA_START=811 /DNA_END=2676 /DNA_ORIENTATION=+
MIYSRRRRLNKLKKNTPERISGVPASAKGGGSNLSPAASNSHTSISASALNQRGNLSGDSSTQPHFEISSFIESRDYTGAIAILEFHHEANKNIEEDPMMQNVSDLRPWIAYCAFHLGDYEKAVDLYDKLSDECEIKLKDNASSLSSQEKVQSQKELEGWNLYKACCYFFLGMYGEARDAGEKGTKGPLRNRLLFHSSDKLQAENDVLKYHQEIQNTVEDQMSLAAMHYMRNHIPEATDIYKRILADNHEYSALNIYIALCYYRLYDDMSEHVQEIIDSYLRKDPFSATALNLKACNQSKSFNGTVAIQPLQPILDIQTSTGQENFLIKHNMVVFKGGEGALQVLPDMLDMGIPEARLNLVIYYLRHGKDEEAYELMKDIDPGNVSEYILKAVVNATLGQKLDSREHLRRAQKYFQLVGSSQSDCDTIPGRQCMASCYFLLHQWNDVILYLNSIKDFFPNEETFNWNFGLCHASMGNFRKAEEAFSLIQDAKLKQDFVYISWLARCRIMNGNPAGAWDLYLQMDSNERMRDIVQLIADDCYRIGSFYYAAKAFDVLERLDPNPEFYEGKRGACIGCFQMVIAGKESKDRLRDIVSFMRSSSQHQESEYICSIIEKWAAGNL